jgi:hypothetical protein
MIQLPVNAIRCQLRLNDLVNIRAAEDLTPISEF